MKYLIIVIGLFILTSCGDRKRNLVKNETKIEQSEKVDIDSSVVKDVVKKETVKVIEVDQSNSEDVMFKGEVDKPEQPATVETKTTASGGKKLVFTNFKSVDLTTGKEQSNKSKDSAIERSEIDRSEIDYKKQTETESESLDQNKALDLDRSYGFQWWWLLVAAIIYGGVSIWRKSLKPWSWFKLS